MAKTKNVNKGNENAGSNSQETNGDKKSSSLFGDFVNTTVPKSGGLFGNLVDNDKSNSGKKDTKLFANTGSSNLFANSKLFNPSGTSLFSSGTTGGNSTSSLFGAKPLFNFSSINSSTTTFLNAGGDKKKDDDSGEEGEGDNDLFHDSPNPYNSTEKITLQPTEKSPYAKKYLKEIENLFVFIKEDGKFVSKGKGYLSLEYADIDDKKVGVVVFR
jgi:hypothetical protein